MPLDNKSAPTGVTLLSERREEMANKEPVAEQNIDGYGAPLIPWTQARERFEEDANISPTHWLATVRPDGRPHVMPVWQSGWMVPSTSLQAQPPAKARTSRTTRTASSRWLVRVSIWSLKARLRR